MDGMNKIGKNSSARQSAWLATALGMVLGMAPAARAGQAYNEACPDLNTCAKSVSTLLGQKYLVDPETQGGAVATQNLELTKDNAEILFTTALHANGYTRVPLAGVANTFRIMRERDARDSNLPHVIADSKTGPDFSNTWDLGDLVYKLSNPEIAEHIARTLRSFLPANSRVIPDTLTGHVRLTAAWPELRRAFERIRDMDQKPSDAWLKDWKDTLARAEARDSECECRLPAVPTRKNKKPGH